MSRSQNNHHHNSTFLSKDIAFLSLHDVIKVLKRFEGSLFCLGLLAIKLDHTLSEKSLADLLKKPTILLPGKIFFWIRQNFPPNSFHDTPKQIPQNCVGIGE